MITVNLPGLVKRKRKRRRIRRAPEFITRATALATHMGQEVDAILEDAFGHRRLTLLAGRFKLIDRTDLATSTMYLRRDILRLDILIGYLEGVEGRKQEERRTARVKNAVKVKRRPKS